MFRKIEFQLIVKQQCKRTAVRASSFALRNSGKMLCEFLKLAFYNKTFKIGEKKASSKLLIVSLGFVFHERLDIQNVDTVT